MTRTTALVAVLLAALLVLTGCNRDGDGEAQPTEAASDPLSRGLQAHVDGDLEGARAAYEEALDEDPDDKLALYNLGLVEQSYGNSVEAEQYYRRVLDIDEEYTPAMFNLAILRTAAGDLAEAIDLYGQVTLIDEENSGAWLNLGFALRESGLEQEADEAFARAIELDPELESRINEETS